MESIIVVMILPSIPNVPPCNISGPFVIDLKIGVEYTFVPLTAKPYTLYCAQFQIECHAHIPHRPSSFNTYKAAYTPTNIIFDIDNIVIPGLRR